MKVVSVVIPTHNRADLLEKAINSVLKQTYTQYEIIIVDDASTDNTKAKIESLNNDKITYIRLEESRGGNYARNLGVQKSNGEYIAFLDDDDEWLPSKLEEQMLVFYKDKSVGLVYTGSRIIYTKNNAAYSRIPTERGNLAAKILIRNYIGTTSSVMVRKEIFEQAGGFDNHMPAVQDLDLWIRICQITKIDFIKKELINYYNHGNKTQITDNLSKIKNGYKIIDKKYANLISNLNTKEQKKRLCYRYNLFGKRKLRTLDKNEARKYFLKSFNEKPNITSVILFMASFTDFSILVRLKKIF